VFRRRRRARAAAAGVAAQTVSTVPDCTVTTKHYHHSRILSVQRLKMPLQLFPRLPTYSQ
ncbi:jg5613, partial [Pararge aegeria aegeria]